MRFSPKSFVAIFGLLATPLFAQDLTYKDYKWEQKPILHKLNKADSSKFEIILKDKLAIEYAFDDATGDLYEYKLKHRIIRVNSNDAIEENNRVYLPLQNPNNLLITKARVIKPNGSIQELDKGNIQEAKDEENERTYKYFAFEGIELGSEIEYLYLIKTAPNLAGQRLRIQDDVDKNDIDVEIISPRNLVFDAKSLNGLKELSIDTVSKTKNILKLHVDHIDNAKKELFAVYEPNLEQIHYKLQYNLLNGQKPLFSYNDVTERLFDMIYQPLDDRLDKKEKSRRKKEKKLVKKFIKNIDLKNTTEEQKIRVIEDYIKGSFNVVDAPYPQLDEFSFIFEQKVGSEKGLTKLFVEVLGQLDIKHQLVLTSNRNAQKFDPKFETYDGLQKYLIYIPSTGKHFSPTDTYARSEFIPHELTHNYGLYIEPIKVGNVHTALAKIKFIDALSADATTDKLSLDINFDENSISKINIDLNREINGYYAQYYQPYYDVIQEDAIKEINESLVKYIGENIDINDVTVENTGTKHFGKNPLIVNAKISSTSYMERAGKKYIFKIGELIGPQAEMYQENERKFDVENDFNRKYVRNLTFHIPNNYYVKNLDDLNLDVFQEKNGERTMSFKSSYTKTGNTVKVEVIEYYENIVYDLKEFEEFRKVINAAADFNKIVLFLEKK